jgi:hypothetical protein
VGAEPAAPPQPWLAITPKVAIRVSLSTVLISVGMYYLVTGRREADLSRMWTGAVLCLLSLMTFSL